MYTLKGTITAIKPTQQISDKFSKREIVVNDNSRYPQEILFQFTNDNCMVLDSYKVGQDVEVSFNLRGREWTSPQGEVKYFNTLEGWKIEGTQVEQTQVDDLPF